MIYTKWVVVVVTTIISLGSCDHSKPAAIESSILDTKSLRTDSIIISGDASDDTIMVGVVPKRVRYNVAFLVMDGTYNTELTAPFDVFHHTHFREGISAMNVFTVSEDGRPICTFEGLEVSVDYSILRDELPPIDILVIPSAAHHTSSDMNNKLLIQWIAQTSADAMYVTSHCDGSFMLAKAGVLDTVVSTTFPADIDLYKSTFPHLKVAKNVYFVHDGKYITSQGGTRSFEAALYLCEILYGTKITKQLAEGLVIDWNLKKMKTDKKVLIITRTKIDNHG